MALNRTTASLTLNANAAHTLALPDNAPVRCVEGVTRLNSVDTLKELVLSEYPYHQMHGASRVKRKISENSLFLTYLLFSSLGKLA